MKRIRFFGCVVLAIGFSQAWGAPIYIDLRDCSVEDSVKNPSCPNAAACRHRGEQVHWVTRPGNSAFQIQFSGVLPFAAGDTACLTNTGQPCKIRADAANGEYDYTVQVGECAIDPKIIVN